LNTYKNFFTPKLNLIIYKEKIFSKFSLNYLKMKSIIICCILLLMNLIASVKSQISEDQVTLVCPDGLQAEGLSWYGKPPDNSNKNIIYSKYFSICVNCKPENDSSYQWIEICFANNKDPLGGPFIWKTQSCGNKTDDELKDLLPVICQKDKPVCGLIVTNGMETLTKSIEIAQPIPCANVTANPTPTKLNLDRSIGYDVELACPANSTVFGLERLSLPTSYGYFPVLSVLCKLNDKIKEHMIFIYAKGKLNDSKMMQLFAKSPYCPMPSQKGNGTRCELMESPSEFCSLRWDSTSENSTIKLLNCSNGNEIDPQAYEIETSPTSTTSSVLTTPAQLSAIISIEYVYIIIGACLGFLILLIIVITLYKIKVKKLKRENEFKKNCIAENATTQNDGNNPVNDKKSEDLCYEEVEEGQVVSGARIFQRRNHKIPIYKSERVELPSNDKYIYTVPDREEKGPNYMNAEMFIK